MFFFAMKQLISHLFFWRLPSHCSSKPCLWYSMAPHVPRRGRMCVIQPPVKSGLMAEHRSFRLGPTSKSRENFWRKKKQVFVPRRWWCLHGKKTDREWFCCVVRIVPQKFQVLIQTSIGLRRQGRYFFLLKNGSAVWNDIFFSNKLSSDQNPGYFRFLHEVIPLYLNDVYPGNHH